VVAASELGDGETFAEMISREPDPALAAEVAENCRRLLEALGDEVLRTVALAAKLGVAEITIERNLAGCREIREKCLES
jgi:hypothetical protein